MSQSVYIDVGMKREVDQNGFTPLQYNIPSYTHSQYTRGGYSHDPGEILLITTVVTILTLLSFAIYSMVDFSNYVLIPTLVLFVLSFWTWIWASRFYFNDWKPSTFQKLVLLALVFTTEEILLLVLIIRNTNFVTWVYSMGTEQFVVILFILILFFSVLSIVFCLIHESYKYSHISYSKMEESIDSYRKKEQELNDAMTKANELSKLREDELEKQKKITKDLELRQEEVTSFVNNPPNVPKYDGGDVNPMYSPQYQQQQIQSSTPPPVSSSQGVRDVSSYSINMDSYLTLK